MTGSVASATGSPTLRRTLSQRRGSLSASDPYALNADMETARGTASRITIVRVTQDNNVVDQQQQQSGGRHQARRSSWGSQHSATSSTGSGTGRGPPGRLSFAFSSFTPIKNDGGPPSPGLGARVGGGGSPYFSSNHSSGPPSPRLGPSGNISHGRPPSMQLTPQQICDLAATSIAPKPSVNAQVQETRPATFLPLPDEQYLPFLDRPAEVSALLQSPPTSRLMALLSQTFPADRRDTYDPKAPAKEYKEDPTLWSFAELSRWLFTTTREEADDRHWVAKTRTCILARSELIWSRLKAALGVPPELEEEEEEDEEDVVPTLDTEAIGEDATEPEAWLEPILPGDTMTCVASPINIAPPTDSFGMESIGEGAEEPEDPDASPTVPDPDVSPNEIQGLRISTPMVEVPATRSPLATPVTLGAPTLSQPQPRSGSLGLRRTASTSGNVTSAEERRRESLVMAGPGRVRRSTQQERGTGDALFPTSFAALTMGPSLVANNPALRSGPRRTFRPGVPIVGGRVYRVGSADADGNDYALSLGTGSERSFR